MTTLTNLNFELVARPFDPQRPGFGLDFHHPRQMLEHDMATALFASAMLYAGERARAEPALDRLVESAFAFGRAEPGWGLPFAWDAFSDGSVNPISTIYAITTAFAVRALMDGRNLPRGDEYVAIAVKALDNYWRFFTTGESGCFFWYSDQPQDAKHCFNVSSMLAGQYARACALHWRAEYAERASSVVRTILAHRQDRDGLRYWRYSTENDRPNDLVHACYILQGLLDVKNALGLDIGVDLDHVRNFIHDGAIFHFAPYEEISEDWLRRPARAWGVGMALHLAAELDDDDLVARLLHLLQAYVTTDGVIGAMPGRRDFYPRQQAHVLFGMARSRSLKRAVPAPQSSGMQDIAA